MSDYDANDDFARSLDVAYAAIRERIANGGLSWNPKLKFVDEQQHDQKIYSIQCSI